MKTFRKLQARGSKDPSVLHFRNCVATVRRILGKPSTPASAASFHSQDDFARAYLSYSLTRKAVDACLFSEEETLNLKERLAGLAQVEGTSSTRSLLTKPLQASAYEAFAAREEANREINERETFGYDPSIGQHVSDDSVGLNVLLRARDIVKSILGLCDYAEICANVSFGSGASASLKRTEAQREKKYLASLTGTRGILPVAGLYLSGSPVWSDIIVPKGCIYVNRSGKVLPPPGTFKECLGSVLDYVPKDATTDRIIMKEPELNGYFQKGLGSVIRKRLRRWRLSQRLMLDGIDLNTSGDLNKDLAKAGSMHGHIGTVDAKQASDSITLALGEFLLPPEWFKVVCAFRSPYVRTHDRLHRLQMIGGMGNGFTFELESLLFYAIGVAAAGYSKFPFAECYVSIHGDDLTIPSDVINEVTAAYTRAGVIINQEKSFVQGPFRESCGGHFFNGYSVKPFYIKRSTGSCRGDWFWLANSLLNWLSERSEDFLYGHRGRDLLEVLLHIRQYASSNEPRKWTVGVERGSRSGLYGLAPYKMHRGWPMSRIVKDTLSSSPLPEDGVYLAWLQQPTRQLTPLEMCRHTDTASNDKYSSLTNEGEEREVWARLHAFTPFSAPYVAAPLWQLCRDHNLNDF